MKAVVLEGKHQPLSVKEVEMPQPKPGHTVVKVLAAALNHRDLFIQQGLYPKLRFPLIPGSDVCGIAQDGPMKGKRVIVQPGMEWGSSEISQSEKYHILGLPVNGCFAEYVMMPNENIYPAPEHLTNEEAAALPLAGLTAWRALMVRGQLKKGEKVLVTGGGGGVAQMAIMFAVAAGAKVAASTGSTDKALRLEDLGVQWTANYKEPHWHKTLVQETGFFDLIVDGTAGPQFPSLIEIAAPGGRIAIYGGTAGSIEHLSLSKIFWRQLSLLGSTMGSPQNFEEMLAFVHEHKLKPVVDMVFPLADASTAFERMDQGKQFGKIVLKMAEGTA